MKILLDAIQFAHRAVDTVIVHGGLYDGDRCRLIDARDRLAAAAAKVLGVDEAAAFLEASPDYRIDQPHPAVGVGAKPAKEDCPLLWRGQAVFWQSGKGIAYRSLPGLWRERGKAMREERRGRCGMKAKKSRKPLLSDEDRRLLWAVLFVLGVLGLTVLVALWLR